MDTFPRLYPLIKIRVFFPISWIYNSKLPKHTLVQISYLDHISIWYNMSLVTKVNLHSNRFQGTLETVAKDKSPYQPLRRTLSNRANGPFILATVYQSSHSIEGPVKIDFNQKQFFLTFLSYEIKHLRKNTWTALLICCLAVVWCILSCKQCCDNDIRKPSLSVGREKVGSIITKS